MKITTLLASTFLLAACAHQTPSRELLQARAAYNDAARGNAAKFTPAELHEARTALSRAEAESSDAADSQAARDLSYVAMRKAQRAEALGNAAAATAAAAAFNAERGRSAEAMLETQQGRLRATQSELERQRAAAQQQQAELARQQAELAKQQAETAAERQARLDAEKKAADAEKQAKDAMDALGRQLAVKDDSRGTVITLSGGLLFPTGKATLLPGATAQLDKVAEALRLQPERHFTIEGHTDSTGSYAVNADLSARRANTVRDYLISRGVAAEAISAVGVGSQRPVADNRSTEGRAMNRRVEIIVDRTTSDAASAHK